MALPSGYSQLKYVTVGTEAFLRLGTTYGYAGTTYIYIDCKTTSNSCFYGGSDTADAASGYYAGAYNNSSSSIYCFSDDWSGGISGWSHNTEHTFEWDPSARTASIDGVVKARPDDYLGFGNLYVLYGKPWGSKSYFYGEVYEVKVASYTFTPALRLSDNVAGFYCSDGTFYATGGDNNFGAGPLAACVLTLNVNLSAGGTVYGAGTYDAGTSVSINASPKAGYRFLRWELAGVPVATTPTHTVILDSDKTYTAIFELIPSYTVTTTVSPNGTGTITGAGTYLDTTSVTITANPSSGYAFQYFSYDGITTTINPLQLSITKNYNITAVFKMSSKTPEIDLLEPIDIALLKDRLNIEFARRTGNGSLEGWNTSFSTIPRVSELAIKIQDGEVERYAKGDSTKTVADNTLAVYNNILDPIVALENGTESSTNCNGLCTGFCSSTCSGTAVGIGCIDCTSTCSISCTATCGNNCTDGCTKTCGSGCINTCSGSCANSASGH